MKDSIPLLVGAQVRAARALLGWSQEELAQRSELNRRTIALFEEGKSVPYSKTDDRLRQTFEASGVAFLNDDKRVGVILLMPETLTIS